MSLRDCINWCNLIFFYEEIITHDPAFNFYDGREPNKYLEKFSIGLKGKDKV